MLDGFDHLAVIGSGVRVRAEPDSTSPVLGSLSFDVVSRGRGLGETLTWGGSGWEMTFLLAGD